MHVVPIMNHSNWKHLSERVKKIVKQYNLTHIFQGCGVPTILIFLVSSLHLFPSNNCLEKGTLPKLKLRFENVGGSLGTKVQLIFEL